MEGLYCLRGGLRWDKFGTDERDWNAIVLTRSLSGFVRRRARRKEGCSGYLMVIGKREEERQWIEGMCGSGFAWGYVQSSYLFWAAIRL